MSLTTDQPILGHEKVWERFQRSYAKEKLASTYLFVGPAGIGKRTVAVRLAKTLICDQLDESFTACNQCASCKLITADNHPDLITVAKPEGKNFIPLELLIGDREHRRRSGLCHDISLTPYSGKRKVAIIDDADHLNAEGANCLLKTLEEPPARSILILIGTSEHRQLPTILSRSQIIRFQPLGSQHLATLIDKHRVSEDVKVDDLVNAANGSLLMAMRLSDQELFEFRERMLAQLGSGDPAADGFAKAICDFVDNRSKDAAARREEYVLLADIVISFFESAMRSSVDAESTGDEKILALQVDNWLRQTTHSNSGELAADCIERTEQFQFHIGANLAPANAVPAWLNDLGAFARGEKLFAAAF